MNNSHVNPVGTIKKDIYIIKNDINNKVYIGQSLNSEERFKSHCYKNKDNSLIDKAIKKYGKEHFWYEIIEYQIENYNEREKFWIKYYNSKSPFGYNILEGGEEPPYYYGDESLNTKISDKDVLKLKEDLSKTNISLGDLAKKYGISKKQVIRINQGISRSVTDEVYPIRKKPNPTGKLTEEDVDSIIDILKNTYRLSGDIAREFGVEVHTISKINNGKAHHRNNICYPIRKTIYNRISPLNYEQVSEIISLLIENNESLHSISKKYNVDLKIIQGINRGTIKMYIRDGLSYPLRKF